MSEEIKQFVEEYKKFILSDDECFEVNECVYCQQDKFCIDCFAEKYFGKVVDIHE